MNKTRPPFEPKQFELVVFDWDGTLMDSTSLIAECVQLAAADVGLPVPETARVKHVIGLGMQDANAHLFPGLSHEDQLRLGERFRAHILPREDEARLYDGVIDLLEMLVHPRRFVAIATGKPRRGLDRVFAKTDLKKYFHFTRCGDEGFPKPHPDMLQKLMEFTGTPPHRTLMIGDTTHDLNLAANAGTHAVAVTWGAHPAAQLRAHSALHCFNEVSELADWLYQHG